MRVCTLPNIHTYNVDTADTVFLRELRINGLWVCVRGPKANSSECLPDYSITTVIWFPLESKGTCKTSLQTEIHRMVYCVVYTQSWYTDNLES